MVITLKKITGQLMYKEVMLKQDIMRLPGGVFEYKLVLLETIATVSVASTSEAGRGTSV